MSGTDLDVHEESTRSVEHEVEHGDRDTTVHPHVIAFATMELAAAIERLDALAHRPAADVMAESAAVSGALVEPIHSDVVSAQAAAMAANAQRGSVQWVKAEAHASEQADRWEQAKAHAAQQVDREKQAEAHALHQADRQTQAQALLDRQKAALYELGQATHQLVDAAAPGPRLHAAHFRSVQREPDLPQARIRFEDALTELRTVNLAMSDFVLRQSAREPALVSSSATAVAVTPEHHVTLFLGTERTGMVQVTMPSGDRVDVTVHDRGNACEWSAGVTGANLVLKDAIPNRSQPCDTHFSMTVERLAPARQHDQSTDKGKESENGFSLTGKGGVRLPLDLETDKAGRIDLGIVAALDHRVKEMEKGAVHDSVNTPATPSSISFTFEVVRVEPAIEVHRGPGRER